MRRWESYVALIAVVIGSLSSIASDPKVTYLMVGIAVALLVVICVSLVRRGRERPRVDHPDPAELAQRIRDQRRNRFHR